MSPGLTRHAKGETYDVLEDIRRIIDQSASSDFSKAHFASSIIMASYSFIRNVRRLQNIKQSSPLRM